MHNLKGLPPRIAELLGQQPVRVLSPEEREQRLVGLAFGNLAIESPSTRKESVLATARTLKNK